jgi:GntR family transcriptional repressor for pyruvate dehydrogenase complex
MSTARSNPTQSDGARLNRTRVADQIIVELQAQIASGAFPKGSKLPSERELAGTYGVSTPTVREALRALTSMGLVEVRHGSGAYVATASDGLLDGALAMLIQLEGVDVLDLIGLLRVLNLYVAELAVEHASDEDIRRVRAGAEATLHCDTFEDVTDAATEFLYAFIACAHQPLLDALCGYLVRMVAKLETAGHPKRSAQFWRKWAADSAVYRLDIAEALERRDLDLLTAEVARFHAYIRKRITALPALRGSRTPVVGSARAAASKRG